MYKLSTINAKEYEIFAKISEMEDKICELKNEKMILEEEQERLYNLKKYHNLNIHQRINLKSWECSNEKMKALRKKDFGYNDNGYKKYISFQCTYPIVFSMWHTRPNKTNFFPKFKGRNFQEKEILD